MFCKSCGVKLEDGTAVCPVCGRETDRLSGGTGFWDLRREPAAENASVSAIPQTRVVSAGEIHNAVDNAPGAASGPARAVRINPGTPPAEKKNKGGSAPIVLLLVLVGLLTCVTIALMALVIPMRAQLRQLADRVEQAESRTSRRTEEIEPARESEDTEDTEDPEDDPLGAVGESGPAAEAEPEAGSAREERTEEPEPEEPGAPDVEEVPAAAEAGLDDAVLYINVSSILLQLPASLNGQSVYWTDDSDETLAENNIELTAENVTREIRCYSAEDELVFQFTPLMDLFRVERMDDGSVEAYTAVRIEHDGAITNDKNEAVYFTWKAVRRGTEDYTDINGEYSADGSNQWVFRLSGEDLEEYDSEEFDVHFMLYLDNTLIADASTGDAA